MSALAAIEPLHLRAKAWIEYARVIVSQGDQVGDPAAARECYERAGDVLWECANDAASAAACYERAAVMAPREMIGNIVPVTVTHIHANSLFGVLASAPRMNPESALAIGA